MKKFKITSRLFTGQVDLWYNADNTLCYLNLLGAVGPTRILTVLLTQIPFFIKSGQLERPGTFNTFKIEEVAA